MLVWEWEWVNSMKAHPTQLKTVGWNDRNEWQPHPHDYLSQSLSFRLASHDFLAHPSTHSFISFHSHPYRLVFIRFIPYQSLSEEWRKRTSGREVEDECNEVNKVNQMRRERAYALPPIHLFVHLFTFDFNFTTLRPGLRDVGVWVNLVSLSSLRSLERG